MKLRSHVLVHRGEKGMALVVALLILLALTVLGSALMLSVNTESRIAGAQLRDTQGLGIAEAGIQEAMLRIRNGDVPDNLNKRQVTLIYEAASGSIPVSGSDTTSLATIQPAGSYLGYAGATKKLAQGSTSDLTALTIRYKTRITLGFPPDTQIVRYDDTVTPKYNTATGTPVFQIVATGTKGTASRSVIAEVTRTKFNILAKGAVAAQVAIAFKGNISICGHNHIYGTALQTQVGNGNGQCEGNNPVYHVLPVNVHTSCLAGAWSGSTISEQGSTNLQGNPAKSESQAGFYSGPWDCVGMNQSDYWSWVGSYQTAVAGGVPRGIYYLDNNTTKQDQSGSWSFNGGDGEGFLYCDGDLYLNGSFTFKGMIYCEGNLQVNGNTWILGGLVVKGNQPVKIANGSATILYSADSIQQTLSKYGGNMRMLTWREF